MMMVDVLMELHSRISFNSATNIRQLFHFASIRPKKSTFLSRFPPKRVIFVGKTKKYSTMATIEGIPQKYLNAIYWKVIKKHKTISSRYDENTIWDFVADDYARLVSSSEPELEIYSLALDMRHRDKVLFTYRESVVKEYTLSAYLLRLLLQYKFGNEARYVRKVLPEIGRLMGNFIMYIDFNEESNLLNELPRCPATAQPAPAPEEKIDMSVPVNIRCKLLTHFIDPDGSIAAVRGNKKKMGQLMAILTGYSESACENYYNLPDFNREVNQTTIDVINALLNDLKLDFNV